MGAQSCAGAAAAVRTISTPSAAQPASQRATLSQGQVHCSGGPWQGSGWRKVRETATVPSTHRARPSEQSICWMGNDPLLDPCGSSPTPRSAIQRARHPRWQPAPQTERPMPRMATQRLFTAPGLSALDEALELLATARVAELAERLGLDLPDALARDLE